MTSLKDYIPRSLSNLLGWSNNFDRVLEAIFESVGITHEQWLDFHEKNVAWAQAMALTESGLTRSPANIADRDGKKEIMIAAARQLTQIIQAYPGTTDGMREQLVITVAKAPSPVDEPGLPFDFKSSLGSIGELKLTWKNRGATGCIYNIQRNVGGTGQWESLGGVGKKKFVDYTFPIGVSRVEYRVQAVRSTGASDWANHIVFIGVSAKGLPLPKTQLMGVAA